MDSLALKSLAKLIRKDILVSTTKAGSGHPSTSLSAVEIATVLFFGGFFKKGDHFVLSKGHASPLLYSVFHRLGIINLDKLLTLRDFKSNLEGHPTPRFPFVEVSTGSLGQGLSVGFGMALGLKRKNINKNVFVLLGDSEFSEGQNYEALQLASYYKCNNLIAILDVNRLGQRGETMLGWNIKEYKKRVEAFNWDAFLIEDGNNIEKVMKIYSKALDKKSDKPIMLIAKTIKGKGVSFFENKDGWHGKALPEENLKDAIKEIGSASVKKNMKSLFIKQQKNIVIRKNNAILPKFEKGSLVSTREAYGEALAKIGINKEIVVLDAEVSNSTFSDKFGKKYPSRFFEMFIAEQNMASAALGMSKVGFIPFISSFSAFLSRAFDQIRIAQYSNPNIKVIGSHAGVHIGTDGASQMGLEDISMMRSILESVVLYPSDAISASKLTSLMIQYEGLFYLRTTREKTPILYKNDESFKVGGSKILKKSNNDKAVIFAAGITLHETLKAYEELKGEGINVTVVDLYSIKPLDEETVRNISKEVKNVIVVEDHYPYGGLGEAVKSVLIGMDIKLKHLAVNKLPRSGKPEELLAYEEIDSDAIIKAVKLFIE